MHLYSDDVAPTGRWGPVHKAVVFTDDLTSTRSNTFGVNRSADSEPNLITQQQQCLTSPGLLWLDGRKYLQPCSKRLVERLEQDEWRFGSVSEQHVKTLVNDQEAFLFHVL